MYLSSVKQEVICACFVSTGEPQENNVRILAFEYDTNQIVVK